jgi:predicted transcriptional regulator
VISLKLAKFIGRHRSQTIRVLRQLQKENILTGKRANKRGTLFVFELTAKGNKLINKIT